ncbi:MAG: diacylglycerol kinase family lipid kinase [Clostridia bacterium]|nr:diacylglycerol kinase family lipid kinase [Clostridia bacterium]
MKNKKRFLLIVNPVSGRGTLRPKLWQILNIFSEASIATTVMFTQKRGDATEFAKSCQKDFDAVVCAGGDGTLNEVISGLMQNPHRHILGYIPVGTTNDLAKSLGLAKSPIQAARDIINGSPKSIDIGLFGDRYFNYIASFGAFTEASYNATQEAKNVLGHFAYILEGIMSVANIRPYNAKFTFNDTVVEGEFIFAAISNTTSVGGVLKLKDALVALNDGEFELLLVRRPNDIVQLNKIVGDIVSQKFEGDMVSLYHASEITVECDEDIDWTLDGECEHAGKSAHIKNVPSAIHLIMPNKD